jgi:TolB-like protein
VGTLILCFIFLVGASIFPSTESVSSIAVLPFVNASNDPNTEYLSDGIAESIIKNLSQFEGVKVLAHNSSFKYRGKETEPQEVANALASRRLSREKSCSLAID